MRQNIFSIFAMSAMLVALPSCNSNDNGGEVRYMLPETRAIDLTDSQKELVAKNNDFSFDLMRKIRDVRNTETGAKESMLVSPLSVTYMLGMLNSGADEAGQQKISETLGMSGTTTQQINELCMSLMTQAPQVDKQVTLATANAVYTNKQYELSDNYSTDMKKYYSAEAKTLDFASAEALTTINNWAKQQTNGMIPSVLKELKNEAAMYLFSSVYFGATWTKQFDKALTTQETFTAEDGTQISVPMMHNEAMILASQNATFRSVRLPYSGGKWSMYIMLPKEGKTVGDVLNSLNADSWSTKEAQYKPATIELALPKFSVDGFTDLKKPLTEMGLASLFDKDSPVLGNICKNKRIAVSEMFQKSRIDVDEEGAEMTAVTVAEGDETTPGIFEDGKFTANRPFVFVVTEDTSNAVFFVGTYMGR